MKKYFLLLTTLLFIGCQQPSNSIAVVQMDDDKTQAIQKMLENYLAYGTDSYDADYDQSIISEDLAGSSFDNCFGSQSRRDIGKSITTSAKSLPKSVANCDPGLTY